MYKKIQPMKHNKTGNFSLKTNVALVYLEKFYVLLKLLLSFTEKRK